MASGSTLTAVSVFEDEVWNRAALRRGGALPKPGDRALASVIGLHGLAMNGGVLDAVERSSIEDFTAALEGYRFLGLDGAAAVLATVRSRVDAGLSQMDAEALEATADSEYDQFIPDDESIFRAFAARLAMEPDLFAPTE